MAKVNIKGTEDKAVSRYAETLKGKNIWWHRLSTIEKGLSVVPGVKKTKAKRHFPNILSLEVTEREPKAFAYIGNNFVIVSEDAYVLSVAKAVPAGLIEIKGIKETETKIGKPFLAPGTEKYNKFVGILSSFADYGFIDGIKYIDFTLGTTAVIKYKDFIIDFGNSLKRDEKMKLLSEIIQKSAGNTKAEIDVSSGEKAYFKEIY
ncbi:cell division protein FtsQ/DivIB [Treponema sp. R6D11]